MLNAGKVSSSLRNGLWAEATNTDTLLVETTFLYGDLEEEIYMECPLDMLNISNKSIYDLVQAAQEYY